MIKSVITQKRLTAKLKSVLSPARIFHLRKSASGSVSLLESPALSLPPLPQTPARDFEPLEMGRYQVRLANSIAERDAACRLRFKVFNIELGEGLAASYKTGLDTDQFDLFCDHLIVEDRASRNVVGTYRLQSGITAKQNLGYYSEQEFEFAPYDRIRADVLELGRASIDREHRSSEVLTLLWRGIVRYTRLYGLRYLIGCSSLTSNDPLAGWHIYRELTDHLVAPEFRTIPTLAFSLPSVDGSPENPPKIPKLLRTYVGVGAKICGPPAWDREFGTIDFLTLLDMRELTPAARVRFLVDTQ